MRVLEQRIIESGEASMANASMVEMQQVCHLLYAAVSFFFIVELQVTLQFIFHSQTVTRLMTQCNEKGFELEVI